MKFIKTLTLIFLIDIISIFAVISAQNWNDWYQSLINKQKRSSQQNCKYPLFSCRLYNRFRSTKRETGFQSNVQPNQVYAYDNIAQPSQAYPAYTMPMYSNPMFAATNPSPNYPNFAYQNPMAGSAASSDYAMAHSVQNPQFAEYGNPQGSYTAQSYGQSPNTIDVHQVLDQFIRSAGLSPQGDHEAQASHSSSFAKAGTKPVFVFKKLFSFPFYVHTDPNVVDVYGKGWKK